MKRYLTTLFALVAMASGAWAVTDYGFSIADVAITSENYQSQSSGKAWYYDPTNNVLHFIEGTINVYAANYLMIDGEKNPNMNISVDGNCSIKGDFTYSHIMIKGGGSHTIDGSGTLRLRSAKNMSIIIENSEVTIKDVTLDIAQTDNKIFYTSNSTVNLIHCAMSLTTIEGQAWYGTQTTITTKYCKLADETHSFSIYGIYYRVGHDGTWVPATEIIRLEPVEHLSYTVDQPTIGQPLHYTADANGEGYSMDSMEWWKKGGTKEVDSRLEDGYVCKVGEVYKVIINSKLSDGYDYADNVTVSINGKPAIVSDWAYGMKKITYTFPELNTYYDLWVGGQQVKASNQDDVLSNGGKVSYDPATNTLYLKNASIANTDYNTTSDPTSGYGIYDNIDGLTINVVGDNTITSEHWTGILSMKNLTFTGTGTLNIVADNGTALSMGTNGYQLNVTGGVKVYAKGMYGIEGGVGRATVGGESVIVSYNTTLNISNKDTELHAYGTEQCVSTLAFLGDGIEYICEDNESLKLYFENNAICYYERRKFYPYSNGWIVLQNPNLIATGIEAAPQIDNGQLTIDNSNDSWFTIDGRKLSGKPTKKGIYIHNGNKQIIK